MLFELWSDWIMMNRLHIPYSQLRREPRAQMLVFAAFARGEDAAKKAQQEQANATALTQRS